MITEYGGGYGGIKRYLENAKKHGRELGGRDVMDERIVLAGNLDILDGVIDSMNTAGQKYIHITHSFSEQEIPIETHHAVVEEYKSLLMAAYRPEEYIFYAEAHLPRLKSYVHNNTGEVVSRLEHNHMVIPQVNLVSGKGLNPVGMVAQNVQWLDAIQEYINHKYGFVSPKDRPREGIDGVDIIRRSRLDNFKKGRVGDFKTTLKEEIIARDIKTQDELRVLLKEMGDAKIVNAGKAKQYLAIRPEGHSNYINLREPEFRAEYLALPQLEKLNRAGIEVQLPKVGVGKKSPEELKALVDDWVQRRSKEVKYINSGAKKEYAAYRAMSREEQVTYLAHKEAKFYEKYRPTHAVESVAPAQTVAAAQVQSTAARATVPVHPGTGRASDNTLEQRLRDKREAMAQKQAEPSIQDIKLNLDAARLLAELAHTHGLLPQDYRFYKGKDGGDRIQHKDAKAAFNVSDFLTKHVHMSWSDAQPYLQHVYQEQLRKPVQRAAEGHSAEKPNPWALFSAEYKLATAVRAKEKDDRWRAQLQSEKERRLEIRQRFAADKARLKDNHQPAARYKAELSLRQMEKVREEQALRDTIAEERKRLKERDRMRQNDAYEAWLKEKAEAGREYAMAELRRRRAKDAPMEPGQAAFTAAPDTCCDDKLRRFPKWQHQVDGEGNVTYSWQGRDRIVDQGRAVVVLGQDKETVEHAVRLAVQKYGKVLAMSGPDSFVSAVIDTVVRLKIDVSFTNPAHNALLQERRGHVEEAARLRGLGQAALDALKAAQAAAAGNRPVQTNDPTDKQEKTPGPLPVQGHGPATGQPRQQPAPENPHHREHDSDMREKEKKPSAKDMPPWFIIPDPDIDMER